VEHGDVELAHDQVGVVARVTDEGDALGVAGQVTRPAGVVAAEQQLGGVVAVVEVRTAAGAVAVDALQVGAGAAGVADAGRLGVVGERSAVMSWATNCPRNGQPAAPSASCTGGPPSTVSQAPPARPSACRAASSQSSAGSSGNSRW
jgi:hypothetical protein